MPGKHGRKKSKAANANSPAHEAARAASQVQDAITVSPHVTTPAPESRRLKKEKRRHRDMKKQKAMEKEKEKEKEVEPQEKMDVSETSKVAKVVSADAACDAIMLDALNNLNTEVDRLKTIFQAKAWFPEASQSHPFRQESTVSRDALSAPAPAPGDLVTSVEEVEDVEEVEEEVESTTPTSTPPPSTATFASALDSLNSGIKLLDDCSSQLLHVQIPAFKRKPMKRGPGRPRKNPPIESTFFIVPATPPASPPAKSIRQIKKSSSTPKKSPHFITDPFSMQLTPDGLPFELEEAGYGLIQERIRNSLFAGVIQTILWNQTTAKAARPVLFKLLSTYPTPESLAKANVDDVTEILRCLGLQNRRAERLVKLAQIWVDAPPSPERRYARRHYPDADDNIDIPDGQLLEPDDSHPGWEIAHLPGIGQYALDSYRIFYRDSLRGVEDGDGMEPEWKRVVPLDKDLRPYLVWRWAREGWLWNPLTGTKEKIDTR